MNQLKSPIAFKIHQAYVVFISNCRIKCYIPADTSTYTEPYHKSEHLTIPWTTTLWKKNVSLCKFSIKRKINHSSFQQCKKFKITRTITNKTNGKKCTYPTFLYARLETDRIMWLGLAGRRPHRFPHNNFSSVYQTFTKLGHMISL